MMKYQLFIDGKWCAGASGEFFTVVDPSSSEELARISRADTADTARAAAAAKRAMAPGSEWTALSDGERAGLLRKTADYIEEHAEEFARAESCCNGRLLKETRGEAPGTAEIYRYYAGLVGQSAGRAYSTPEGYTSMSVLEPVGVVGAIAPWNYPMMIMANMLAPALAAGNAVLFKPSSVTPLTAILTFQAFEAAGFPAGSVNLLLGRGEVGQAMAESPDVDMISFVGGTVTGKKLMSTAACTVKKLALELGGKSPVLVFDDSDMDTAVENVLQGIFASSGQICTAGSRVFIQEGIYEKFLEKLAEGARKIRVGRYDDENADIGGLASEEHMNLVLAKIQKGLDEGARLVCGGHRMTTGELARGCFVEPTIFADISGDMDIARTEIFGPVLCAASFKTDEEGIALANETDYGLAAYAYTRSLERAMRAVRGMKAGNVTVNGTFGGCSYGCGEPYKQSGTGCTNGSEALRAYQNQKMVNIFWKSEKLGFSVL
jgi:betaine-aldehyde dehydrogenase